MIGLMASMMVMELKHGHGVAGIEGSIGKALDMVLEYIGFIRVMCTLGNGLVGRAMGVAFIPVRMVVVMWESLSGVLNTVLDTIISGNGDGTLLSILPLLICCIFIYVFI